MVVVGLPPSRLCGLVPFMTIVVVGLIKAQTLTLELIEGSGNKVIAMGETTELRCTWRGDLNYFFRMWIMSLRYNVFQCQGQPAQLTPRHTCLKWERTQVNEASIGMVISNVSLKDAGNYSCGFTDLGRVPINDDERSLPDPGYLTVIAPPDEESPHCSMNDPSSDHEVGADIQMKCISSGGVPPAQLSWYKGPNLVAGPSQGVLTYTHRITDNDDGLELTCLLNSSVLRDTRNCSVMVDIPSEAEIQPSFLTVESGANVSFTCIGRYFQDVSTQYTWDLPNESRTLDFDHQIQGDVLYLLQVRTTRISEEFNLTCFVSDGSVGGRVWGKATLQIVSVKTPTVPTSKSSARPTLPGSSSSPDVGLSIHLIVLFSCIPVVLIVIIACLILLWVKMKNRRKSNTPRASDDNQHNPGADYMDLSNTGRLDEQQRPAYQGLVPEYLDLTCPPDRDGEETRPVSETVYDDVEAVTHEYETPITVIGRGKEDVFYVNHDGDGKKTRPVSETVYDDVEAVTPIVGRGKEDVFYVNHYGMKGNRQMGPRN